MLSVNCVSDIIQFCFIYSNKPLFVTQSGKTGLIAYFKVSRNAGFKYLVCCSSTMVEAMCTKFSLFYTNSLPSRAFTVQVVSS